VERWDAVVVGGGISGASFAHFAARRGLRLLVLEKEPLPGGAFATWALPGGFWVELGAHTIYSSYAGLLGMVEELGLSGEVLALGRAPYRALAGGRVGSLLARLYLGEAVLSLPRFLFGSVPKEGRSAREYYSALLGKGNYARLVSPVLTAILSQNPDGFPAEVLLKRRPRDRRFPRSFTLRGGLRRLVQAALAQDGVTLRTGAEVEAVWRDAAGYRVSVAGGETVAADRLCLAAPAPVAARLLAGLDPEGGRALAETAPAVRVETLGVAAAREAVGLAPFAFVIAAGADFTSVVSRDVLPDPALRGFAFHFPGPGPSREEKLARARELLALGGGDPQVAEAVHLCPRLSVGHRGRVEALEARLRTHPGLAVVGNYFDGLAIEDCVQRAVAESGQL